MNKEYFRNQKGLTLVEILIGILITTLMMGALYTCLLYTSDAADED